MNKLIALLSTDEETNANVEVATGESYGFATPHGFVIEQNDNGKIGGTYKASYPVLTDSIFRILEGKVLTVCDATFTDKEQREAFKRIMRNEMRHWFSDRVQETIDISNGIWTAQAQE